MDPQTVMRMVFEGGIRKPIGTDLLSSLQPHEVNAAEEYYRKMLWADKELIARGINDFYALNEYVKECARKGTPTTLSDETRKALVVLANIFMYMHEQKEWSITSLRGHPLAEDCILNAAYSCQNPDVLIAAGRFYLSLWDADVETAIAYFIKATEIDPKRVNDCDRLINDFVRQRGVMYLRGSLEPYLDAWRQHKRRL
ncbi:MAG: hypothetical protein RMK30_07290 [Anaerolineae bacterium]|nr:hypothetical protein [Anaerolineae bacterium]